MMQVGKHTLKKYLVAVLLLGCMMQTLLGSVAIAQSNTATPIGYWRTIDDVTGKPKSIIRIWRTQNQQLAGEVIQIFPKQGESPDKRCVACRGKWHNQPIVGMVILSGLKPLEKQWGQGEILDPENGKTYKCSLRLAENGKKLRVHGYIGVPLFGRSQTWERVDLMAG